jgi:cytochrome P450
MTAINIRQRSVVAACEAFGVPPKDWPLFTRWASAPLTPDVVDHLHSYVDVMIAERCTRQHDDLLATLIELDIDGQGLTNGEIRAFVVDLVIGA